MRYELFTCAFLGLLIFSLFFASVVEAASYPDLSVIGVGPWDASVDGKYVSGYRVAVANYGSGPSKNATLEFYVRTYDGKTLNRNFTVPAMPAGSARSLKFSMCNGTDGSFKNGYVIVNRKKAFIERSYRNNARNFGLKETMLLSSNKTVTETYKTLQTGTLQTWTGTTYNYTSPASGKTGISTMRVRINAGGARDINGCKVTAPIPGAMHENVTFSFGGDDAPDTSGPTSWNDSGVTFYSGYYITRLDYAEITVTGENLESKNVFKEPIQVYGRYYRPWPIDNFEFVEITTSNPRTVQETYSEPLVVYRNATYVGSSVSSYTVHNQNVTGLKVLGDPRGLYVAGWFIQPQGNFTNVTAIYGTNSLPASSAVSGYWGVRQSFKGSNSVGFQINGTDLKGFSNFKTFGFAPWTWRDTY